MNAAAPTLGRARWMPRRLSGPSLLLWLGGLLLVTLLWAAGQGAYSLPLSELPGVLLGAVHGRGMDAQQGWAITPYAWWVSRWGLWPLWMFGALVLALGVWARNKDVGARRH